MNKCLFCKIVQGDVPSNKIYENDKIFVFMDIKPITPGHTLIVPKKHFVSFDDLEAEYLNACMEAAQTLGPQITAAVEAEGFNLGINNGEAAGQIIMHTHFHIIPRKKEDGLSSWPNIETPKEELNKVFDKIVNYLKK